MLAFAIPLYWKLLFSFSWAGEMHSETESERAYVSTFTHNVVDFPLGSEHFIHH